MLRFVKGHICKHGENEREQACYPCRLHMICNTYSTDNEPVILLRWPDAISVDALRSMASDNPRSKRERASVNSRARPTARAESAANIRTWICRAARRARHSVFDFERNHPASGTFYRGTSRFRRVHVVRRPAAAAALDCRQHGHQCRTHWDVAKLCCASNAVICVGRCAESMDALSQARRRVLANAACECRSRCSP